MNPPFGSFPARFLIIVIGFIMSVPGFAQGGEASDQSVENNATDDPAAADKMDLNNVWIAHADIVGLYNPLGIAGLGGVLFRHPYSYSEKYQMVWSYIQGGADVGINPAYAQAGAHIEWMPLGVLQLRLAYDFFGYFGNWGALMSFDDPDAEFGDDVVYGEREGEEEPATAHRLLFRPILRAKFGPVVIQNTTDVDWYHFNGDDLYFYEMEYDTLLNKNDFVFYNRTDVLLEAWTGAGDAVFLLGPLYEITHGFSAEIDRQRFGGLFLLIPFDSLGAFGQLRIFAMLGANLQDRNRDNQFFALFGIGSDWYL